MGKASRLKAARRRGELERTEKQEVRRALKVDRRGRNAPPTVESFERLAGINMDRFAQALITRHNLRMEWIGQADDLQTMQILSPLAPITTLYRALIRLGASPVRAPSNPQGDWPDHLMWGVDSAVATTRLLLCGQIVGAAAVAQHQMERWMLHRAHNGSIEQRAGESTADFVARVWSTEDRFHENWFVEPGVPPIFDESALAQGPDEQIDHAHITTTDGRVLCPATIYCFLSEIMHGRFHHDAVGWDSQQMLAQAHWPNGTAAAVDIITSAVSLCLRQIRLAVASMAQQAGDVPLAVLMKGSLDSFSTPGIDPDHHRQATQAVLRDFGLTSAPAPETATDADVVSSRDEGEVTETATRDTHVAARREARSPSSPPIHFLAPLVPQEGLSPYMTDEVDQAAAMFWATFHGERPLGRLFTDDEFVTLAFAFQRSRAIGVANAAMENEREMLGEDYDLRGLTNRSRNCVILARGHFACLYMDPSARGRGRRGDRWLWLALGLLALVGG